MIFLTLVLSRIDRISCKQPVINVSLPSTQREQATVPLIRCVMQLHSTALLCRQSRIFCISAAIVLIAGEAAYYFFLKKNSLRYQRRLYYSGVTDGRYCKSKRERQMCSTSIKQIRLQVCKIKVAGSKKIKSTLKLLFLLKY